MIINHGSALSLRLVSMQTGREDRIVRGAFAENQHVNGNAVFCKGLVLDIAQIPLTLGKKTTA